MPIRASGIRGQLRFWWRLQHRQRTSTELYRRERALWGGLGRNTKEVRASRVGIRVQLDPKWKPTYQTAADYAELGYILWPLSVVAKGEEEKRLLAPGINFSLQLSLDSCDDSERDEVEFALRCWASFGGVGARTRRGLGAVQVKALPPVSAEDAQASLGARLVTPKGRTAGPDPIRHWKAAIQRLQTYRQGPGFARNRGTPHRPGPSRWPEAAAIRAITGRHRIKADGTSFKPAPNTPRHFPRAYFGLPLNFHFQNEKSDQYKDPGDISLTPHDSERMASPLILRPIASRTSADEVGYLPGALLLPFRDLSNQSLSLGDHSVSKGWPAESKARQVAMRSLPGVPADSDLEQPLEAFLHYFEKGRV